MSEKEYAPLSAACVRALNDKLYDKRKAAALEIEKWVLCCHLSHFYIFRFLLSIYFSENCAGLYQESFVSRGGIRLWWDLLCISFKGASLYWIFLSAPRMVKDFVARNKSQELRQLIKVLGQDFAASQNPNTRKGGLIGLAATAIALGKVMVFSKLFKEYCLFFIWKHYLRLLSFSGYWTVHWGSTPSHTSLLHRLWYKGSILCLWKSVQCC